MGKSKKMNPTPLPAVEAWSKGLPPPAKEAWSRSPPPPATAPSPRSQSPAPPTPIHHPHSQWASTFGHGFFVRGDDVAFLRSQVESVKPDSAVTDSASAPIPSSPAPIPAITSKDVNPCETLPATPTGHVNGKASKPLRTWASIAAASSSSSALTAATLVPSSSSIPPISPTVIPSKHKIDIKKMVMNPSSTSSSHPSSDSSSPSMRNTNLPSSSHPPPSQLGTYSFTPFVPRPQQQGGPNGDPPRSPSYPQQMPNGTGPRSQGGMPCPSYYYPDEQSDVYTPWYPSMPTQHQPSPPHGSTPVSPRNPSPSMTHPTTSIGSLPSPPPMPSSSSMPPDCLDGVEVNPENVKNTTLERSSPPPPPPSTSRQDSLWTTVSRPSRIRIESEDQRRQQLAKVEEKRKKEEEAVKDCIRREEKKKKRRIRREEERKEKERMKQEQERLKEAEEREVQRIKEEEEREVQRIKEEEEREVQRIKEEEEREVQRIKGEEEREVQRIKEEEEREVQRIEEEEEHRRRQEEETEAQHITNGRDTEDVKRWHWLRKGRERNVAAPPLTTLATARVISGINTVTCPEGPSKLSSEDRFAASAREASVGWAARASGLQFTQPIGMTPTASQGDPGLNPKHTRTKRNKAQNPSDASPGPSVMQHHSPPEIVQHFPPSASPVAAPAPPQSPPADPGLLGLAPSLMAVNPEQIPLIPADRLPGADMNLDEFCAAYSLTDRVRNKLDDNGYCGTHTFQYVEWKDLREAGLKTGEIAQLKHAISKWSVPPGYGRG